MSTSTPAAGRIAAEDGAPRGVAVVDAPVAGMVKGATAGTLQVFAGGDAADVKRVMPLLHAMGDPERVIHVGPRGAGYAVKLCLNLLWFIHAHAAAEVLVLGTKAGVETGTLRRALASGPASSVLLERDIDGVFDGDYDESFTLDLVTKDLGLAVDLGRELGVPLELSALVGSRSPQFRLAGVTATGRTGSGSPGFRRNRSNACSMPMMSSSVSRNTGIRL